MDNSTLVMVAVLAAIAMMAAARVVVLPMQQVHKIQLLASDKDNQTNVVALQAVVIAVQ
jgi:hypothetical protein